MRSITNIYSLVAAEAGHRWWQRVLRAAHSRLCGWSYLIYFLSGSDSVEKSRTLWSSTLQGSTAQSSTLLGFTPQRDVKYRIYTQFHTSDKYNIKQTQCTSEDMVWIQALLVCISFAITTNMPRNYNRRVDPMELRDKEFYRHFRFSKPSVLRLADLLQA